MKRPVWAARLVMAVLLWFACALGAAAEDKATLFVTAENGFGRMIIDFPSRLDLPPHRVNYDNGVLAITFSEPITLAMPDAAVVLPDYVSVGRIDPDRRGVRFGLRSAVTIHAMEAGEKLFVDIMPATWQGLPPGLPAEIVADLAERAKDAAKLAEQKRKAAEAAKSNPTGILTIGRNPTFLRLQLDWNVDTEAEYVQTGAIGTLTFAWPVKLDLYDLQSALPAEILSAENKTDADGTRMVLTTAEGVVPRFYAISPRQFLIDIDLAAEKSADVLKQAQAEAKQSQDHQVQQQVAVAEEQAAHDARAEAEAAQADAAVPDPHAVLLPITPKVEDVAGTIRVTFPFDRDTASAVFRRGDTVWMLFDTTASINRPADTKALDPIASALEIIPAGKTQIVRLDLATDRLATLASEGRAWVLSLGDVLLSATEPLKLVRERDREGHFTMTADLGRPGSVYAFRDPVVGDTLDVVTAYPPSRGAARELNYVDFEALRSAHGLVVRSHSDGLEVTVEGQVARIALAGGLTLSDRDGPRSLDSGNAAEFRGSYVDLASIEEPDPSKLMTRLEALNQTAAEAEGQARDLARLSLAQFYLGNQLGHEAIGVLRVLERDLKSDEMRKKARLTLAIANTVSARPSEAIRILTAPAFDEEVDALMWRAIARSDAGDYVGARTDALASETATDSYPHWVQQRFLLSGVRAAVETSDLALARRYLDLIDFASLSPEEASLYHLFEGRLAEAEGRSQEALDTYGQVIAAEFRPTRAEAVYRTLLLLRQTGRIDFAKASETLSAEALLWRGNALEIEMQKLLAELYFENHDYRLGFDTVKKVAAYYPESEPINDLLDESRVVFNDLFLNGASDEMDDIDALSLFYDFRQLTPTGARGDEMIRNLARRLVKVDLLTQAADLLQYQIDNRLVGVAKAQVAADLALIRIANREPEGALKVLSSTRGPDLPPTLEKQRRVLEARALIDAGREDLALDLLSRLSGREADLLRAGAYWNTRSYTAASDLIETIYAGEGPGVPLSGPGRLNILKAGVGLVLANDQLGLSRIRAKFADRMAQSAEWPMFDYITSPNADPVGVEFKRAAREVGGIDSLETFLTSYRQSFATDAGITPLEPAPPVPAEGPLGAGEASHQRAGHQMPAIDQHEEDQLERQ